MCQSQVMCIQSEFFVSLDQGERGLHGGGQVGADRTFLESIKAGIFWKLNLCSSFLLLTSVLMIMW